MVGASEAPGQHGLPEPAPGLPRPPLPGQPPAGRNPRHQGLPHRRRPARARGHGGHPHPRRYRPRHYRALSSPRHRRRGRAGCGLRRGRRRRQSGAAADDRRGARPRVPDRRPQLQRLLQRPAKGRRDLRDPGGHGPAEAGAGGGGLAERRVRLLHPAQGDHGRPARQLVPVHRQRVRHERGPQPALHDRAARGRRGADLLRGGAVAGGVRRGRGPGRRTRQARPRREGRLHNRGVARRAEPHRLDRRLRRGLRRHLPAVRPDPGLQRGADDRLRPVPGDRPPDVRAPARRA